MIDDRMDRELSTADLATAAGRAEAEVERPLDEREVVRDRAAMHPADVPPDARAAPPLLAPELVNNFQTRWTDIQAGFVDEPRRAVEQADGLVAEAIKQLAESFARERANLEGQWDRGGDVSTEDLRQALQRYRSFFSRLLSV